MKKYISHGLLVIIQLMFVALSQSAFAYCNSSGINTSYEWIDQITINSSVYRSDYNSGYFSHPETVNLAAGQNTIALTPGFNNYAYTENWRGWLDTNGDGVFEESEKLFEYSGSNATTMDFFIPESVVPNTTLRVAMRYGAYPSSCGTYTYGETEDFAVSIEPAYTLTLDPDFTVHRDGSIGDDVQWVVEVNGEIALQRNAADELSYLYYRNFNGSNIRIWLQQYLDGKYTQVSNIVEYTPGITNLYDISLTGDYEVFRTGLIGDDVQWVIEKDGEIVLQRNAANELSYVYFNNVVGSKYRVWLQSFIEGEYKIVSNTISYEPGQTNFTLSINQQHEVIRSGELGDDVVWVVEQDGLVVLEYNGANDLSYTYYDNKLGSSYRIWLGMYIDGTFQIVSNIIEYEVTGSYPYALSVGPDYNITRTGYLGDPVQWVVVKNGSVVLQRNASNELSYTYYSNTIGSTIEIYLQQYIDGDYQPVSNTVAYTVQ